jgi:hypothetical protein
VEIHLNCARASLIHRLSANISNRSDLDTSHLHFRAGTKTAYILKARVQPKRGTSLDFPLQEADQS